MVTSNPIHVHTYTFFSRNYLGTEEDSSIKCWQCKHEGFNLSAGKAGACGSPGLLSQLSRLGQWETLSQSKFKSRWYQRNNTYAFPLTSVYMCTHKHVDLSVQCIHEHGYMPAHRYFLWLCLKDSKPWIQRSKYTINNSYDLMRFPFLTKCATTREVGMS